MSYSSYIPPDLLTNPQVRAFVKVLDGLHVEKSDVVGLFLTTYNPVQNPNHFFLRKFLYGLGQIPWMNGFPKSVFEALILNAYDIMALKGTEKGLLLFLRSLTEGDAIIDSSQQFPKRFIIPGHLQQGYLPDGNRLGDIATPSFLYLFGASTSFYYGTVEIRVTSPYFYVAAFRDFVVEHTPLFLAGIYSEGTNFTFRFYGHSTVDFIAEVPLVRTP